MSNAKWMTEAKWQPIKTAPKGYMTNDYLPPEILVALSLSDGSYYVAVAEWHDEHFAYWCAETERYDRLGFEPTYWMPLPPAPPVMKSKKDRNK
jgi:hypothetical protein